MKNVSFPDNHTTQGCLRTASACSKPSAGALYFTIFSQMFILVLHTGDGKCVICDSYVRPATLVRVCDECNYGSYAGRCVICGGIGVSDAYYCKECTIQEKDVSP